MSNRLLVKNNAGYFFQQGTQVLPGEIPVKWLGGSHEELPEGADAICNLLEVGKVIGGQCLSLQDREIDLDLVEPTGVNRQWHGGRVGKLVMEPVGKGSRAMRTALIDDPKHPPSRLIRFPSHDLRDKPIKGSFTRGCLDASHDLRAMNIPSGQVSPRSAAIILMFDPLPPAIAMYFCRMKADSGLNAGFLVRRNHKFIGTKAAPLPESLIQIQHNRRSLVKKRVPRPDPRTPSPWLEGVGIKNPPDRGLADRLDVLLGDYDPLNIRHVKPAERFVMLSGQFAGDAFDDRDDLGGKKPAVVPAAAGPPGQSLAEPSGAATSAQTVHERPESEPPPDWRCQGAHPAVGPTGRAEPGRTAHCFGEEWLGSADAADRKIQVEIQAWVRAWFSFLKSHRSRFGVLSIYRQNHAKPYTHL